MHILLVLVVEGAARMRSYPSRGSVIGRPQHRFEDEDENAEDEDDSQMSVIVIAANCT